MRSAGGDNRSYHGTPESGTGLAAAVPVYARRVLLVGGELAELVLSLAARPRAAVYAVTSSTDDLPGADAVLPLNTSPLPFPPAFFDAVLIVNPGGTDLDELVERFGALPHRQGAFLFAIDADLAANLRVSLAGRGWTPFQEWDVPPRTGGGVPAIVVRAFRAGYDARAHARRLFEQGDPGAAYDILYSYPEALLEGAAHAAEIAAESLTYLAAMPAPPAWPARLSRYARAHWLFSGSGAPPTNPVPYAAMAAICREIHREDLAARIEASRAYAAAECGGAESTAQTAPSRSPLLTPAEPFDGNGRIRSVLLLTRGQVDYGLDTLYDGLCAQLGDGAVVEYPYKPTLHGMQGAETAYYPVAFDRPGEDLTLEALKAGLRAGRFDLILFGDCGHDLPREEVRAILAAAPETPLAILDQTDSPEDDCLPLLEFLGRRDLVACFKRERIAGIPYHPAVVPMPFSYPEQSIPAALPLVRDGGCFWAGNTRPWLRQLYVDALQRELGVSPTPASNQAAYRRQLLQARVAPSFFGGGFDTVRYWEVPAHGCLLVTERPPIEIPCNFEDGVHAVFFDDARGLVEKVGYYQEHPGEAREIAATGHAHLKRWHTNTARAGQLLGAVSARLA